MGEWNIFNWEYSKYILKHILLYSFCLGLAAGIKIYIEDDVD